MAQCHTEIFGHFAAGASPTTCSASPCRRGRVALLLLLSRPNLDIKLTPLLPLHFFLSGSLLRRFSSSPRRSHGEDLQREEELNPISMSELHYEGFENGGQRRGMTLSCREHALLHQCLGPRVLEPRCGDVRNTYSAPIPTTASVL